MRYPPRPGRESIDFGVYPQALFLVVRNPVIILGPLLAAVLAEAVATLINDGGLGIVLLIERILDAFGLALATLVADMVWRRGRTSFDEAWEQTRLKAGDIVFAALGFTMIVSVAALAGGLIGAIGALILTVAAIITFIYSIPACTIGGVPGGLSLQASLDVTKARPANTILMGIIFILVYMAVGEILPMTIFSTLGTFATILAALFRAFALGYIATVLAKRYTDIAFANR